MDTFTHKELQGSIFKNTRKQTPAQPDYTGHLMINGELMQLAGWVKEGKTSAFLSLKLSPTDKSKSDKVESITTKFGQVDGNDLPF